MKEREKERKKEREKERKKERKKERRKKRNKERESEWLTHIIIRAVILEYLCTSLVTIQDQLRGLVRSSGEALRYGQHGPGSIPGGGEVEIFLHSIVSRMGLCSGVKAAERMIS